MKKKILTLFMALVLVLSNSTYVMAADALDEPTEMADAIPTATGAEAIAAISDENSVVLDIRAAADYNQAHVKGSISNPVCKADFSVTTDERDAFLKFANENIGKDQKVYLICYVGTFCVNHASKWLTDAGYSAENLYRVTGGVWNDADLGAACNSTHYDYALNDVANGDGLILDVRAVETYYENGYIDKSIHQPLFKLVDGTLSVTSGSDELAEAFNTFVAAHKTFLEGKDIYVLCNGGARGAQNATALLKKAGFKTVPSLEGSDVFTIEDGARSDIKNHFVNNQFIDGETAVSKVGSSDVVILDVRAPERYAVGHLKGSLHAPLFTADGEKNIVSSGSDELATNFLSFVNSNAAKFEGKDIYVLCNGGASGAKAATKLLMQAGYSTSDIFTITDGAKGEAVKAAFITIPEVAAYNFVSGAIAAGYSKDDKFDLEKTFIIDVRTPANFEKGHLANSVNWPLFDANGVTNCEDALADAFTANVKANASTLEGKDIFILCNSGNRGAQSATKLLIAAGYSNDDIFTITNGAKGLDVRYAFLGEGATTPVDSTEVLRAHSEADETVAILDVRATGTYGNGHLKGVPNVPVFTSEGAVPTADAEYAKAFIEYVTAHKDTLGNKDIYVLCNSGQSGARAATVLLKDAGYDLAQIHTITGGYNKNADIQAAAIYVSDTRAVNATMEADKLIIDVRSAVNYEKGHLEGSLSLPVFDENNALDSEEAAVLAEEFVAYVEENMDEFEGKTIYLLCNSGNRGALKAIELLAEVGITEKVFIIEGGATNELIQDAFVTIEEVLPDEDTDNEADDDADVDTDADTDTDAEDEKDDSETPKTGDSTPVMTYVLVMFAALAAIFVSKKKLTK